MLRDWAGNDSASVTSAMVFDAADRGDEVAIAILDRVAVLIGRLCANVVLTVQLQRIAIVGGLAGRSRLVLETINRTMRESCWLLFKGLTNCEVVVSDLGDHAGVLGAIYTAQRARAARHG